MTNFGGASGDELRQIVFKIEKLEEEKAEVAEVIRDTYSHAKGIGFDPKVLRKLIALRKKSQDEVAEEEGILDLYKQALGMAESRE